MVNASDGSANTTATVSGFVSIDGGAQAAIGGSVANQGNGQYAVALSQADTNGNDIGFLFTATGCVPVGFTIVTTALNPYDTVRGLSGTALPNAAAEAAGGLYTQGNGAGQINQPANGMVDVNDVRLLGTAWATPTVPGVPNVNAKTWNDLTTVALPLVPTVAGTTLDVSATGEAGVDWANVGSVTTTIDFTNTTIKNLDGNTVQTGDSFTRIGAAGASLTAVGLAAGQLFIKKNTALNKFEFVMTDSTTHAPKTGVTVAATRNIDNAGFASTANTVSEVANGWYTIDFAASDLNGTVIAIRFTGTNADDLNMTFITQT